MTEWKKYKVEGGFMDPVSCEDGDIKVSASGVFCVTVICLDKSSKRKKTGTLATKEWIDTGYKRLVLSSSGTVLVDWTNNSIAISDRATAQHNSDVQVALGGN